MRIVFFVNYGYYPNAPEDKRFQAKVSACLPKEPNESYISHCYIGKIGNYEIKHTSGISKGNSRLVDSYFCAGSLEELDCMIENAIEDYRRQVQKKVEIWLDMERAIEKLRQEYGQQEQPIMLKPKKDRKIIKNFPDPVC
jgi:hypothetical protein